MFQPGLFEGKKSSSPAEAPGSGGGWPNVCSPSAPRSRSAAGGKASRGGGRRHDEGARRGGEDLRRRHPRRRRGRRHGRGNFKDGPLTSLVNNAAGNFIARTEDLSPRGFDAIANIVMHGTFYVTQAVGKRWIAEGLAAASSRSW